MTHKGGNSKVVSYHTLKPLQTEAIDDFQVLLSINVQYYQTVLDGKFYYEFLLLKYKINVKLWNKTVTFIMGYNNEDLKFVFIDSLEWYCSWHHKTITQKLKFSNILVFAYLHILNSKVQVAFL